MAKPISVPNTFAGSTSAIPLVYLDQDFSTISNATNDLATYSNYVTDTGVANAYIANYPANIVTTTVSAGLRLQFKAANANTGTSTLNVQVNSVSIGSGTIKLTDGSNLPANSIVANAIVDVQYDGTNFQLLSDSSGGKEVITDLTVSGNLAVTGTTGLTGALTANVANVTTLNVSGNTTLATSLSGMVKVTSGAVGTGTAGTDYAIPNVATTWTTSQRGTVTTDNDGSFDMSVTNNFKCTPTATFALTFTNITAGQSGYVLLVNTGGYVVTAAATTKVNTTFLSTVSTAGTYLLSYFTDGTNVYVTTGGAMS